MRAKHNGLETRIGRSMWKGWDTFFAANEIAEEDKKRSILLSVCGAKTYKLIRNLATPLKPGDISYADLVKLVGDLHNPKPSVIVQRFKFHSHFRKSGQSVANFVAELRQLSEHCEFGAVLDDMLRDRLVCGINEDAIQRRLLGEATPLTFKRALEISQGMEMAASNAKDIQKGQAGAQPITVHHVKRETSKSDKQVECFRCGGAHYANDCKFKDAVCHGCNKKGHLQKKCRGAKDKPKAKKWKARQTQAATHHVGETGEEEGCSFDMFGVETDEEPTLPYYATVTVNGKEVKFEIDSGATASVIREETYRRTWGSMPPSLCPSKLKLRTYTGQPIPHLGVLQVNMVVGGQRAEGRLVVAKGSGPSLLGRDWLRKIKLNWHEVKYTHTTEDILQRYSDVFRNELGTLKGVTVKLHVDPSATPRFFKPRVVPYAMKGKVEEELARLQEKGIIEPVQFSRWAAPIVPVMKLDETVRICGDYKLTVNQVSKLEEYPLPRVEDLFATLAGGKLFTKLDMSHAYQQLLLDEESKEYVTINTHKGLFKYNRLVFGVASSPAIFQRTMDTLLQGIPQVAVYLDDLLITGATEVEHLSNLE
uniref:ribonuclease H n=1 Tax=Neogobius melanostomus TaxID=47308 RepID=A0A8C6WZ84_9GOBI